MEQVSVLGIDLAKNVFQLHGVSKGGKVVLKKKISRAKLPEIICNLPKCTILMEACGGANFWGRKFSKMGHDVKLIAPQFVKAFVKSNKNDEVDAEAIVEAGLRPSMHFVSIKSIEQQDIQCVHRIRQRLVKNRTALVNEIRGLLLEYGVTIAKNIQNIDICLPEILESAENELTEMSRQFFNELYKEYKNLQKEIMLYNQKISIIFETNEICQKLGKIEGIGPITATALYALVGNPGAYKNGRQFSASLGVVPKHIGTGGKNRNLGISKRGDNYVRCLLIHGGRSLVTSVKRKKNRNKKEDWVAKLEEKKGYNKAAVAIANKNARVAWAIMSSGSDYKVA